MPETESAVSLAEGDDHKRKKLLGGTPLVRSLRRAVFVSGMLFSLTASVFALAPPFREGDQGALPLSPPLDTKKALCNVLLEQGLVDSLAAQAEARQSSVSSECSEPVDKEKTLVSESTSELEQEIRTLVAGTPIEAMSPLIARYDRDIAGLLVGIAKKESSWGERVPLDASGNDCFNYWGYKSAGTRGVAMGHACFGSPEEAVSVVGDRIVELVGLRKTSSPSSMIIWKCGSSCATHSPESVRKWIADVDLYYQKIVKL